jgi:hypothetical protein
MNASTIMRRALEECDVTSARRLWAVWCPFFPQPKDDAEALVTLHRARTEANSIALELRAYSHRWLVDRGWPSGLPDGLKPKAERMYPQIASAVGIAVKARRPENAAAAVVIRQAMEHAVLEAAADKRLCDDRLVKERITEARIKARKRLFG